MTPRIATPLTLVLLATLLGCAAPATRQAAFDPASLSRRYQEGETVAYRMKATNRGRTRTTTYEAEAHGVVRRNTAGEWLEEFAWTRFVQDKAPITLSPEATAFRQQLSLAKNFPLAVPDLRPVLRLVGPITDLLTFYADIKVATEGGTLRHVGDHFRFDHGKPASWADGHYVLRGEDSIDFEVTLEAFDPKSEVATLLVRHVVPERPQITFTADWMRAPVADTPNNWTEVTRRPDGRYAGAVGKELFDARIRVSTRDGRILGATLHNPVEVVERTCRDAALTDCDAPVRSRILREIEIDAL